MKSETIKAIFTNLLFLIGVVLLIIGFSRGVLTTTRLVVFDQYPLDYYAESRCELTPTVVPVEGEVMPKVNSDCEDSLEHERRIKLTDDIVNSITMIVAGVVLTLTFKKFIFAKK